jgi:hypothetical protein
MNEAVQVLHTNAGFMKAENEKEQLLEDIHKTLDAIQHGHNEFVTGFARLGTLMVEVKTNKYWKDWGYESFGKFVDHVKEKVNKGRSQIYNTISVAEKLLPYASESDIEQMGISKANELAKMVKATGEAPTEQIIHHAKNPLFEVEEFKAILYEKYKVQKMDDEKGKYRDLGGFFATDAEWDEIQEVFEVVAKVDPPIPAESSEWARRKEIIWRLVAEFRSTYGG